MEEDGRSDRLSAAGLREVRRDSRDKSKAGALKIEFQYYGGIIGNLEPALTDAGERALASNWTKKLFGVEYHVEVLMDKRNRYLAALAINMINDQMSGVFETVPPEGPLQEIEELSIISPGQAEWERDTTWSEFYSAIPEDMDEISCTFHPNEGDCEENADMDKQLENEFWFLLYHIRPCAAIMPCPASKSKVIHWIYALCRLSAKKCHKMKNLRNEYTYSLYSYVIDLKVAGPFEESPPRRKLPPLAELAKKTAERYPITSPYNSQANSFMEAQPAPEEGAICYVAVTGNMFDPNKLLPR
ncbi:uncharacterized protein LOC107047221 [Diachasma alloeum]|uniref:uncharacterized protein LOC107047221 n=1 Tax=Diachasma alloeum TaxID=454923 RepID=UPI000738351B|nr:uncharacterized protein LOC107047221 [Diachasma alloeum]